MTIASATTGRPNRPSRTDESGQVVVFVALALVVMLGFAALAVDVGHAYFVHRSLQASADAAALAGAGDLPNASSAASTARNYSGADGARNAQANVPGVQTSIVTKCVSIAPCSGANAVVVDQTVKVGTNFAKIVGIGSFDVHVRSTACSPCAVRPLDIMLVLDRTGSMCEDHWGNVDASCTDLENARQGLLTFVGFMDPSQDKVGFAVFPPATDSSHECSTPPTQTSYDSASSPYVIVPLSQDYKVGKNLNDSSELVSRIKCVKGNGVTSYATAIEKAQAELDAHGRANVQDIIVFLSDGAANYGPAYYPPSSAYVTKPCHQGVTSAGAAKSKGTLVYSIGYDLDALNGGANKCANFHDVAESPPITAYSALQQIASGANYFFNKPDPGQLNTIYTAIAADLSGARLIDNGVQ